MKVSKAYFERFKAEFLRWRDLLGLKQYRVTFYQEKTEDAYASLFTHEKSKIANVTLTSVIVNPKVDEGPEAHAKHEAIHLLISRLAWLGECRFVQEDELDEEAEAVVTRLEKVLK